MKRLNEVLRVTHDGNFEWNDDADRMIEEGDFSHQPSLKYILQALRNNYAAVLAEREACAKVCDDLHHWAASCCAKDIRARNSHEKTN